MGTIGGKWDDDEVSVIGDKAELGFIDFEKEPSVCNYNPDEDEGGVVISAPFPFRDGKPQSVPSGKTVFDSIMIKNTTDEAVELWTKIYACTPEGCFTLSVVKPPTPDDPEGDLLGFWEGPKIEERMVQPHEELTLWLSCKPKEIGLCTCVVHLDVWNERIERVAFVLAEDMVSQSLASRKPYSRTVVKKSFAKDEFVAGQRPSGNANRVYKNRLPLYPIPKDIREMIESKQVPEDIMRGLTLENYISYFKTLLIMEEIQLEQGMRAYDMENVAFGRKGRFLTLVVPGLAERRPSLIHGDFIFAKFAGAEENSAPYQGFVHRVEADEVFLRFDDELHSLHIDGNLYNVNFTYNRILIRRQYQAIDAAERLEAEFLFPADSSVSRSIVPPTLVPISCNLNDQQILAVEMILGCTGGPPYIIHGPPGTGKTKTVVEAILQLYKHQAGAYILVCAPSNSAADHILENLLREDTVHIKDNEIFRLNAASRPYDDVNPDFIRFCFFDDMIFQCPPFRALTRYRVIISTYMSASLLLAEGIRHGHFSHIFLDEAGQASEPESMVPISNLCNRDTVVVLAGDPMQLGPVIHSKDSLKYGLGKSFMERLFECEPYCSGNENYITKLVRNYRCHPEILRLPSDLFYEGDLIACKDSNDETESLLALAKLLTGKSFPILFVGIQGCDEREGTNPSWFNRIEASKVVEIVKKLTGRANVDMTDIGIITPYRQQVFKIKKALEDLDMSEIKVGSVEQFQGQERKVIIVSTVRSTVKHNEFDRAHCLGFLSNPRRFNVAITRAMSLLVIVGNPHIISKDPFWNKMLWYCQENESYQGCPLPEKVELDTEFILKKPFMANQRKLGESTYDNQMANGYSGEWTDTPQPSQEAEWNEEPAQADNHKPPTDQLANECSGEWADAPQPSEEAEWNVEPVQADNHKPPTDQDYWSDWN